MSFFQFSALAFHPPRLQTRKTKQNPGKAITLSSPNKGINYRSKIPWMLLKKLPWMNRQKVAESFTFLKLISAENQETLNRNLCKKRTNAGDKLGRSDILGWKNMDGIEFEVHDFEPRRDHKSENYRQERENKSWRWSVFIWKGMI